MASLTEKKDYPLNYPSDVLEIIHKMSFSRGKSVAVVGSMSLKSQQYAGDYDMIETVKTTGVKQAVAQFQQIVRDLLKTPDCFVGDIKAGIVPEWELIPDSAMIHRGKIVGYNPTEIKNKAKLLREANILTEEEYKYASSVIVENPSVADFLAFKKELRFHIVRWSPKDVLKGTATLRDGRKMSLVDAFKSPAIVKLDVVALVQNNRFTDFSIIYLLESKGKPINAVPKTDEVQAIKNDLMYYLTQGNYFKASKRLFSLARQAEDRPLMEKLNAMMNGDMGRLYSLVSDVGTLLYLLENESELPLEKVRYEIDQFRARLGNIPNLSVGSKAQLERILAMEDLKSLRNLAGELEDLNAKWEAVLNAEAKRSLTKAKLLPIPAKYSP
jgi:hypothetical protein